jgi:aspartate carbamoyltransferase regulatory subunit
MKSQIDVPEPSINNVENASRPTNKLQFLHFYSPNKSVNLIKEINIWSGAGSIKSFSY